MDLLGGDIIEFLKLFFIPQNYLFSLFGAIVGFFLVFLIKTHKNKKERLRYIDAIVWAFFTASLLGYFGALLGWQVYGIPSSLPLSITYDHIDSIVKDRAPLFPLALLYIVLITGIIMGMRKISMSRVFPDGLLGYIWIWIFSLMIFLGEFLSGTRKDIFYDFFSLSLNQIWALIGLIFAILWILRIIQRKI
jgi:Prolipoprotein diacylglyceryl transferase